VKARRGFLLALFIYVTLDLSLPTMPGAFVFEPCDSVDGIQVCRGRGAADVVVAPWLAKNVAVTSQSHSEVTSRLVSTSAPLLPEHRVVKWLPRATLGPAPPSEDPQ
jgi:hypothetical protein